MIALLALDLDGTLLDARGEVPPGLLPELRRWQQEGAHVAVLTARAHPLDVLAGWPVDTLSRGYGAQLIQQGRVIRERVLNADPVAVALACLRPDDLRPGSGKAVVVTRGDSIRGADADFMRRAGAAQGVLKVIHGQPDAARMDELEAAWAALPAAQVIRERAERLVLLAPGADKGAALRALRESLSLPMGRVLAAGDGPADAPMLAEAGVSVRVGSNPTLSRATLNVGTPAELAALLGALRVKESDGLRNGWNPSFRV